MLSKKHNKEDFRKSFALETKNNIEPELTFRVCTAKPPSEFRWKMGHNKPPSKVFKRVTNQISMENRPQLTPLFINVQ